MQNHIQHLLERDSLSDLFSQAVEHRLVSIIAATGYGKTTAILEFLSKSRRPSIYIPLSPLDNFIEHFWQSVTTAAQQYSKELADQMTDFGFPGTVEKVVQFFQFIDSTFASKKRPVVALDSFDAITNPDVRDFIGSLANVNASYGTVCLMIASRNRIVSTGEKDLLHQAVAKAGTHHFEIRQSDLAFDEHELKQLFLFCGNKVTAEQTQWLLRETEGWPAVLNLHCLQSRNQSQNQTKDDAYALSEAALAFANDVFEHQYYNNYPEHTRHFLALLSALPRFSLNIVKQLPGIDFDDAKMTVEPHLFINRDYKQDLLWLHRLYALFLDRMRAAADADEVAQARVVAGSWFVEKQLFADAFYCFFEAKAYDHLFFAMRMLWQNNADMEQSGLIASYLAKLPANPTEISGESNFHKSAAYFNELHINQARILLLKTLTDLKKDSDENKQLAGEIHLVLAEISVLTSEPDALDHIEKAAALLPGGSPMRSKNILLTTQNDLFTIFSGHDSIEQSTDYVYRFCRFHDAVANGSGYGFELLFDAEASFYAGDLFQAETRAIQAVVKAEAMAQHDIVGSAYYLLARIETLQGSYEEAAGYLATAKSYAKSAVSEPLDAIVDMIESRLFIILEDSARVADWLKPPNVLKSKNNSLWLGRDIVLRAAYLLRSREYEKAYQEILRLDPVFEQRTLWPARLSSHIIKSISLFTQQQVERAKKEMQTAYEMGSPYGVDMSFVEFGVFIRPVLQQLQHDDAYAHMRDWAANIIALSNDFSTRVKTMTALHFEEKSLRRPASVHLTKREISVLELLAKGHSRGDIAGELGISINGVKKHLNNIYTKLGAKNRADAIHTATIQRYI